MSVQDFVKSIGGSTTVGLHVSKGGPGSGRRPGVALGVESPEQQEMRSTLDGFDHTQIEEDPEENQTHYYSSSSRGRTIPSVVSVDPKGNWEHNYDDQKVGSGQGPQSLNTHLSNFDWDA